MTEKNIKIRAVLDNSQFDQQVNQLQQKLRQMDSTSQYANKAQSTFGESTPFRQAAGQYLGQEQQRNLQELRKEFNTREQFRRNQEKQLANINKELKDSEITEKKKLDLTKQRLETEEKISKLIKEQIDIAGKAQKIDPALTGFKGAQQAPGGAGAPPPLGGDLAGAAGAATGPGAMAKFGGLLKGLGIAAIIRGALNAVATGMEDIISRQRKVTVMEGQFLQSAAREMRETYEGRGSEAVFYGRERANALEMSLNEAQGKRTTDVLKAGGTAALGIGGGAAIGAKLGAFGGPLGILAGGAVGAGVGATASYFGMGERQRAAVLDPEKYKAMVMQEAMKDRESIEAGLLAKDPRKFLARQAWNQNYQGFLQTQRQAGLSDQEMFAPEGTMQQEMKFGEVFGGPAFSREQIEQSMNRLAAAGATTEQIRAGGGMSQMMARQFDMMQPEKIMGRISGAGVSANQTDDAFKRLLAEGVKIGVDASSMPRELERFTQLSAELATKGGGFSELAAETMGLGMAGFSKTEMEAARTTAEEIQQRAKAAGGYEAQLGFSFLQGKEGEEAFGKEAMGKLRKDAGLMNAFNQLSAEDLERDETQRAYMAEQLGISEKTLMEGVRKKDIFKQTRTEQSQSAAEKLGQLTKGMTVQEREEFLKTDEGKQAYGALSTALGRERGGFYQQTAAERKSEILAAAGITTQEGPTTPGKALETVEKQLRERPARTADEEIGAKARGQMEQFNAINEQLGNFATAAKIASSNAEAFGTVMNSITAMLKKNEGEMNDTIETLIGQLRVLSAGMPSDAGYTSTAPGE